MDFNFSLIHGFQVGAEIVSFTQEEQKELETPAVILMISLGFIKLTLG